MAKKNKKNDENEWDELEDSGSESKEKSGGNRIITIIIALVIVLIWLGVFAILIKLDVGGFGSGVLRPILKDVPIINRILPAETDEEYLDKNQTSYKSLSEAIKRINELELQLESQQDIGSVNGTYIKELEAEVERLKVFETNQAEFEQRVKDFETNVVFADEAPSIEEYQAYYEALDPENAAELYRQVVEQISYDKKTIELANRYARMEPAAAAEILSTMTSGDLDIVCGILSNLKDAQAAAILGEMDPLTAAQITKKMSITD